MSLLSVRTALTTMLVVVAGWCVAPAARAQAPSGDPILIVGDGGFAEFYPEILRAEGLNEFAVTDLGSLSAPTLAAHQIVVLAESDVSPAQAQLLQTWVSGGGNLVAMRPDVDLAGLLGLGAKGPELAEGYLQVAAGQGVTTDTMQFHGNADRWSGATATTVARLFTDADSPTAEPAVTLRSVGSGEAAAFTYDLARSIVLTRQGNRDWAGQEFDNRTPVRSDDLFFGDGPDGWLDRSKVHIPQADEQQRLLANLITRMNLDRAPLPRFYYLPRGLKAAVVMTGDDHAGGGTDEQFTSFENASPAGCSVADWECVRATSYVFPNTQVPGAAGFVSRGFELALHLNTSCGNRSDAELQSLWTQQASAFRSAFGVLPLRTNRTHCVAWSGWVNDAVVELQQGVRLDTNYYYWPGTWALGYPGMFTGSGFPMRFADGSGSLVDVYQAATQLTDEWDDLQPQPRGIGVAAHIDALLARATGAEAYFGVFTANMHTDHAVHDGANAIVAAAQRYRVPVISAAQLLDWLDDRTGSSFEGVSFTGGQLRFRLARAGDERGLEAMVPASSAGGPLVNLARDGVPVPTESRTVKGIQYLVFPAIAGAYIATYGDPPPAPDTTITAFTAVADAMTATFASDVAGATFECSLDGVAFSACASPRQHDGLGSGQHTFRVRASAAGRGTDPTPAERTFTVDLPVPPETTITRLWVDGQAATAEFISDAQGATFECSLDGAGFSACTSPRAYAGLAAGQHALRVRATAAGGTDTSPAERTFTVAESPPDTTITAFAIDGHAATAEFISDAAGATFECSLDDGDFSACVSPRRYDAVASGQHLLRVRGVAAGGTDATPAERTFTILADTPGDVVPPVGGGETGTTPPPEPPETPQGGVLPSDRVAPRMMLRTRRTRMSSAGLVVLRATCPRAETRCRARLRLRLDGRAAGATSMTMAGGRTASFRLRVRRTPRRRLVDKRSLRFTAVITARDAAGNQATVSTVVRLLAPRRR